ncbi:MAG TPA: ABC transporter ATP-binding protein [Candidatus Scatocola faecipullorum]|uniref:ABC transporter ATP-binding protein n=1 Tax=Candidatus Scatocola faecipullorum TaxID=2840917 RepID=A0A9D1SBT0_9PROT|nr:MAG: ABC transporter [Azospirillum sp.]HIU53812.1 ABC transporter ATP-binding protein [Candidatus Scatocola faecipullorum]
MWPFVKPYMFRAILAILICIPIGALDSVVALSLKPYMDIVLVDKTESSPAYIPLLIVAFTSVQGFLNYAATYLNTWVGTKINQDLKRALYKKLLHLETSYYDQHNSGFVIQRFNTDCDIACSGLLENLKVFVSRFFSSISLICVLIYNSWQLAIIAVLILGCALMPLASVRRRIKRVVMGSVVEGAKVVSNYNETYSGNKTIASYNLQNKIYNTFDSTLHNLFKLTIKMVQKTAWMTPALHIIVSIGIGAVIGYGSYLIVNGDITSGNFVSFITALILLYTPIKSIGKNYNAMQVSFLAIERVVEILETEPTIFDKPNAVTLKGVKKSINFNHVYFEYKEGVPVLKDINLEVKAGTTVALVGNSGGGKTTIVNLIPRFYDVKSGSITIDKTDIRDISLESLRDNIAVVFQDNFLFAGTIRDNILLGKEDATEEEIATAVKMACLDEFINELENGLDTKIGERGSLLSGGQRQRLAIARAFIKNAPVVILDEATSALDNKAEAVVQRAIDNLMQDRTVFVIAHRLSTVQNADKIVVINDGEIIETGTHEELLQEENGAYKALYNAQFKAKKAA